MAKLSNVANKPATSENSILGAENLVAGINELTAKLEAENAIIEAENAEAEAKAEAEASEPTSDKLTAIRSELDDKLLSLPLITVRSEKLAAVMKISELQQAELLEIAAIKKAELERKADEAKQLRISEATMLLNEFLSADLENYSAQHNEALSLDEKNAANAEFKAKFDQLINIIISTAPKAKTDGKTAASGASDTEIQTAYNMLVASGKSEADAKKALEAEPHNFKRSTIWFAIDRLKNPAKYAAK